jgi:hypothetical protein
LCFEVDAAEALDALERGGPPPEPKASAWLLGRDGAGEPVLLAVDPSLAEALKTPSGVVIDRDLEEALVGLALVEPVSRAE